MKPLIPYFIEEKFRQGCSRGEINAFAMFIDLSGFTPVTEKLMRKGNRGAEQLSNVLNEIFAPLVNLVYAKGGFIPYFAGDAFTAIFPSGEPGVNAEAVCQTAIEVRERFVRRKLRFGEFKIGIKAGLSYGNIEWGLVGRKRKTYYFRGTTMEASAKCQTLAGGQEIVIDAEMKKLLPADLFHLSEIKKGFFKVDAEFSVENKALVVIPVPPLSKDTARFFLPDSIVNYTGQGEFRTLVSVFISFAGLDDHKDLDEFTHLVLQNFYRFSGYFKEVEFGDKGGVMVGFFGAPVSFENNVKRALEFIFELERELKLLQTSGNLKFRAGLTLGTAYTGIVGGEERCQYAAVGNRVNLAARVMSYADWGEVLVDRGIAENRYFRFSHKGDIKYKGIQGQIPTFKLDGREQAMQETYSGQMIGREIELKKLLEFCNNSFEELAPGVASIYGEAGIGKSRLIHELKQEILGRFPSLSWFVCQTDQILRKAFNPFIYFLKDYFAQKPDNTAADNKVSFEERFNILIEKLSYLDSRNAKNILKELHRTKSVLAALVSIQYPDALWEQLDAKGRYQNSMSSVVNLIFAEAILQPLILEIEDGHWMDDGSKELLQDLFRQLSGYNIILIITSRLRDDGRKPVFIDDIFLQKRIKILEVDLGILQPEAVTVLAETTLNNRWRTITGSAKKKKSEGHGKLHRKFYELLLRNTNSNPFYVEQMLEYFIANSLLKLQKGKWTIINDELKLPNSINAILTARLDRLPGLAREVVKAAAVIGREFEIPVLHEVVKRLDQFSNHNGKTNAVLQQQIDTVEKVQIWLALNELRYVFKHSLLREAVYDMQLRATLKQLHLFTAHALEKLYAKSSEERFADLAFHFEKAEDFDKTRKYLYKAATYAEDNYQIPQALEYYNKLLIILKFQKQTNLYIKTLLKKGKILELRGKWDECEDAYHEALALAEKSGDKLLSGRTNNQIGHLFTLKGDYISAKTYLQSSVILLEALDDTLGVSKVNGNLGNLHFRQGNYRAAKSFFVRSIEIPNPGKKLGSRAQIVANLGLTYMNQGDFEEAIICQKDHLAFAEKNTDKPALAVLYTNLGIVYFEKGDYDAALESYQKGLRLSEELGNMQLTSIAIGCIGSVYERKGDYPLAMKHFERDLELCEEMGDKQGLAIALGLIGEQHSIEGNFFKAIEYLQKNLMLCEELGYQKGIAKAVNTLGDVFFHLEQYDRSMHYYDRAIEVTRNINNKLVLGISLVEKGAVLMVTDKIDDLKQVTEEALDIARELGNPNLLFDARLLDAQKQVYENNKEAAFEMFNKLLKQDLPKDQQATVYFELYKLYPEQLQFKTKALRLYHKLYEATPRHSYKTRIEQLEE